MIAMTSRRDAIMQTCTMTATEALPGTRKMKDGGMIVAGDTLDVDERPHLDRMANDSQTDFDHLEFADVLNIVDDVQRGCIRAVVNMSISGPQVVRALPDLIVERGKPEMIVSDNGTGLTTHTALAWSGDASIE